MSKTLSFLRNTKEALLELFFPTLCLNCQAENEILCQDCLSTIEIMDQMYCHICGQRKPFKVFKCEKCCSKTILSHLFFAVSYKENVLIEKALHRFKYSPFIKDLGPSLANLLIVHFKLIKMENDFLADFVIIPVPLHLRRERNRGFNQSAEIAKYLAQEWGIPMNQKVLRRTKNTVAQIKIITQEGKRNNIKDAFVCFMPHSIKNKNILLVDDVYTSGATMEECGLVLKKAGAKRIFGCVVAISQ